MSEDDLLSNINPKTVGYGKSGSNPYTKDDQYSRSHGSEDMVRKIMAEARQTGAMTNLTRENLEVIMDILGSILGSKVDRYSPLNRQDEEHFRHQLEEAFRHNKLSRLDIEDAWKIWHNFKR